MSIDAVITRGKKSADRLRKAIATTEAELAALPDDARVAVLRASLEQKLERQRSRLEETIGYLLALDDASKKGPRR